MRKATPASEVDEEALSEPLLERFEGYSRMADWMAAAGLMGYAFASVTNWKSYVPDANEQLSLSAWWRSFIDFVRDNGWAPALVLAAIGTYIAGRVFARKNIGQLRSMFADENRPTGFQIISRWKLFLMIFGQLALIIGMVKYSREVAIPCAAWVVLHVMYLYSNHQQRYWTNQTFSDEKYTPRQDHPHKAFIEARRAVALHYLARSHDAREIMVICGALAAIALDQAEKSWSVGYGNTLAYVTIIAVVAVNEMFAAAWRQRLERGLRKANVAQLIADRKRGL